MVKRWFLYAASCGGCHSLVSYIFAHATVAKRTFRIFWLRAAVARRTFWFYWMNPIAGFGGSIARGCSETWISCIFAHAAVAKRTFGNFWLRAAVARRTFWFCWMNPLAGFGGSTARNLGETQISYIFAHAAVAKRTFRNFWWHATVAIRAFWFCWMNPLAGFVASIARNCKRNVNFRFQELLRALY